MRVPGRQDGPGKDPSIARIIDYLRGGNHFLKADEEVGRQFEELSAQIPLDVRDTHGFVGRGLNWVAGRGTRQFLICEPGLPHDEPVHEVIRAASADPAAVRIAYADRDTEVISHVSALIRSDVSQAIAVADPNDPRALAGNPLLTEFFNWGLPVCVALGNLNFTSSAQARSIFGAWRELLPPGSSLIATVGLPAPDIDPAVRQAIVTLIGKATDSPVYLHTEDEVNSWVEGLTLVAPGVTNVRNWLGAPSQAPPRGPHGHSVGVIALIT